MLLRTYEKILDLFHENYGYMSFEQLKENGITVTQIQELSEKQVLDKFARGWYWCKICGVEKPADHKYIEIGKANSNAVICMDSACYLHGLLKTEPDVISVATERTDRKKMEFEFPVKRYYLQNAGREGEIEEVTTKYGSYKVYSVDRTMCDCIRMRKRLEDGVFAEIETEYNNRSRNLERLKEYAKNLRALKCIIEWDGTEA